MRLRFASLAKIWRYGGSANFLWAPPPKKKKKISFSVFAHLNVNLKFASEAKLHKEEKGPPIFYLNKDVIIFTGVIKPHLYEIRPRWWGGDAFTKVWIPGDRRVLAFENWNVEVVVYLKEEDLSFTLKNIYLTHNTSRILSYWFISIGTR